ncbi:hypothetical protein AALO_G00194490 [Alosa alosa]|uniref:Uncharacterized protein n=1 Tax=Alosa alosa TaxID=278164 RepID=A0AAV6G6L6_9TELE|nr:hypothetical protein AALO_G00194490 [Alosa alosa]
MGTAWLQDLTGPEMGGLQGTRSEMGKVRCARCGWENHSLQSKRAPAPCHPLSRSEKGEMASDELPVAGLLAEALDPPIITRASEPALRYSTAGHTGPHATPPETPRAMECAEEERRQ